MRRPGAAKPGGCHARWLPDPSPHLIPAPWHGKQRGLGKGFLTARRAGAQAGRLLPFPQRSLEVRGADDTPVHSALPAQAKHMGRPDLAPWRRPQPPGSSLANFDCDHLCVQPPSAQFQEAGQRWGFGGTGGRPLVSGPQADHRPCWPVCRSSLQPAASATRRPSSLRSARLPAQPPLPRPQRHPRAPPSRASPGRCEPRTTLPRSGHGPPWAAPWHSRRPSSCRVPRRPPRPVASRHRAAPTDTPAASCRRPCCTSTAARLGASLDPRW